MKSGSPGVRRDWVIILIPTIYWGSRNAGANIGFSIHHDDAQREWAYDRTSHIGKLDQGLDFAQANGWTVVSMKNDWETIFVPASKAP